jgi:hypothetical protein
MSFPTALLKTSPCSQEKENCHSKHIYLDLPFGFEVLKPNHTDLNEKYLNQHEKVIVRITQFQIGYMAY